MNGVTVTVTDENRSFLHPAPKKLTGLNLSENDSEIFALALEARKTLDEMAKTRIRLVDERKKIRKIYTDYLLKLAVSTGVHSYLRMLAFVDEAIAESHAAGHADQYPIASHHDVMGYCPSCGSSSLFLDSGGYVTCSWIECPEPSAASKMISKKPAPSTDVDYMEDGKRYRVVFEGECVIRQIGMHSRALTIGARTPISFHELKYATCIEEIRSTPG